jgi:hypothetical protein
MRSVEEIKAKIAADDPEDLFGVKVTHLLSALSYPDAASTGVLNPKVLPEEWDEKFHEPDPVRRLAEYLPFAMEKASNHRGLSAGRSVQHVEILTWLAGTDDDVEALKEEQYEQYGVPKLFWAANRFGLMQVWEDNADAQLDRMASGEPCSAGCDEGCGR